MARTRTQTMAVSIPGCLSRVWFQICPSFGCGSKNRNPTWLALASGNTGTKTRGKPAPLVSFEPHLASFPSLPALRGKWLIPCKAHGVTACCQWAFRNLPWNSMTLRPQIHAMSLRLGAFFLTSQDPINAGKTAGLMVWYGEKRYRN